MALIFIVEDDPSIQEIEMMALKNSNYMVQAFDRAAPFYDKLEEIIPDLVLLDIMLPDEDGYKIVRKLRGNSKTRRVPVIMITAKTTEMDMLKGLDDGADDYIRKPFSVMELLSRVRALLRRSQEEIPEHLLVGNIMLDHEKHAVISEGRNIVLTLKEYELLRLFLKKPGQAFTRDQLLGTVWGSNYMGETRTVDVHIASLRTKLGAAGESIKTVRGVGYRLEGPA